VNVMEKSLYFLVFHCELELKLIYHERIDQEKMNLYLKLYYKTRQVSASAIFFRLPPSLQEDGGSRNLSGFVIQLKV
ncbi:MAG: hypothetical protein AAGC43_18490, partial [Bacteroidota bacterium]